MCSSFEKMGQQSTFSGRLFLAKGDEEIFVDVEQVLPHQLHGIRFLYRQFKKKEPGVILNDPTGYGKTLQVILFIKAIKHLLKKPIMILCSEHEKNHWLTHFQEFTDYGDGILIEPPNLNLKKIAVCINTKGNVDSLMKREWSILVVDDDTAINDVLKRKKVNADYKIWLTSVDMKTNLIAYWKIFAWLYPKEENIEKIILESKAKRGSIKEQILIDAAMEGVVLRRVNKNVTPFGNQARDMDTEIKVLGKNKNESGTKIKRSKIRKTDEISDMSTNCDDEGVKIKRKVADIATNNESYNIVENIIQSKNLIGNASCINHQVENEKVSESVISEVHDDTSSVQDSEMKGVEFESVRNREIEGEPNTSMEIEPIEMNVLNTSDHCDKGSSTDDEGNNISVTTSKIANITNKVISPEKIKENTKETSKNKSIDEYMKEMEEKALKKFKGSFLDSIF